MKEKKFKLGNYKVKHDGIVKDAVLSFSIDGENVSIDELDEIAEAPDHRPSKPPGK